MRKVLSSILLVFILAAGIYFSLMPQISAFAAGENVPQDLRWDPAQFGRAAWDAVDGATAYRLKLYKGSQSSYTQVGTEINCGTATSYNLISNIRAEGPGKYTFTVSATTASGTSSHTDVDFGNLGLDFEKLDKPTNLLWDWNTNEVVRASWSEVSGAENYFVQIYKKTDANPTPVKFGNAIDCGTNTSASVFDAIKSSTAGYYSFSVYATSSRMADSDEAEYNFSDNTRFFKYPIKLSTPQNVHWSHYDGANEYGIARWDAVPNATGYIVQFYQVLPYRTNVLDADGKPVKDPATGQNLQQTLYHYYEAMGNPVRLSDTATDKAPNFMKADNLIKGSGTFMFSVTAVGSASFENSEASAFLTREIVKNADGRYELTPIDANGDPEDIEDSLYFKYVAPTRILLDIDMNGVPDADQNQTIYLATGQKRSIRVIVEPSDATPTGFIWSNSKNSAAFDYFTSDGEQLTMSAHSRGRLEISVTPSMSSLTKTIFITASEPPVKMIISGKNSYTTNDTGELYLEVIPSTAYTSPEYIDWISSNPNVATVSGGRVTTTSALTGGKSIEYATITARSKLDDRIQGTYRIAVSNTQILPSRIVITGHDQVALKSKLQLTANVYAGEEGSENESYAYNKNVAWSTNNDKIATVDAKGLVTPKAVGKVTITAVSQADGSSNVKASKEINVIPEEINITRIALSGGKAIKVGESVTLKAAITPANATDRNLVWTVSGHGQLSYVDELTRTLTGTSEGDCVVTVYSSSATSIRASSTLKVSTASDKPNTEDGETEVITDVKPVAGTGDKKDEYTAVIKAEVINEAIDKALSEASRLKTTPVVKIRVDTPASAVHLITSIPYNSVGRLIGYWSYSNKAVLEVETGIATMRLNADALRRIYNKAYSNSDIELKMSRTVKTELNEAQQKAVGSRSVVELTIRSAGKEISEFDGYPITISLPFTLSSAQSGKGVQVDNLTSSGQLLPLSTDYNHKTKCVYFDVTHLSYFSPYYHAAVAWQNPFTDVRSYDWFYDSVFYVVDRQLMQGISAERFVPESITTRGQVVTILHRLAGLPAPEGENTFKDVKADQWYTDAVLWATENGLVSGYGGGYFGPEDRVTREQLGVMLHNYAKYVDITPKYGWDTPMRYPDSYKVSSWARQGAMYCQITNIITGRPSGGFEPQGTATRSELATMLFRMNDQMQKQLESQS